MLREAFLSELFQDYWRTPHLIQYLCLLGYSVNYSVWFQTLHAWLSGDQHSCFLPPKKKKPSYTVLDRWCISLLRTCIRTSISIWSLPIWPFQAPPGKVSPSIFYDPQGICTGLAEGLCCRLLLVELLAQVGPWNECFCVPRAFTLMATSSSQEQHVCSS